MGINGKAAHEWVERYRYQTLDDIFRVLEMERIRERISAKRLPVNLAKRRGRMLGIKKRSGRSVFYPATAER